jgi:polysaccharide export outer membrane protein
MMYLPLGLGGRRQGAFSVRLFDLLSALGFCLTVTGCGGVAAPPASSVELQALKAAAAAVQPLQPGEKIHVIVYGESSLTGEYLIDPSGFVSLPLAGTVKAEGLTPGQLGQQLATRFKGSNYLKSPQITVEVVEFRPFYILGEIQKPGAYPYIGGLNILSAFAIGGGRTYRANRSIVLIQHAGEKIMHEYDLDWPIPILPGDIIEVPRRYI